MRGLKRLMWGACLAALSVAPAGAVGTFVGPDGSSITMEASRSLLIRYPDRVQLITQVKYAGTPADFHSIGNYRWSFNQSQWRRNRGGNHMGIVFEILLLLFLELGEPRHLAQHPGQVRRNAGFLGDYKGFGHLEFLKITVSWDLPVS